MLPTSLKAGTLFGQDFEILQRLAQGGMGTVYVALQHSTGKKRALKVMHAQYEGDDTARKRFIQEAKAGASIDSDHIVEMVGAGIDPETNTPWIAMELLKGDDLKNVLAQRKRLTRSEVLEVFRQICHALGKAHKMGLVHRDLKPENIFLATPRREGIAFTAKILDFGIAKLVRDASGAASGTQTQAIGSPRWMSPEQADRGNAPISPSTDVWALGLLAFNLLTGEVYWKTAHSENPSVISQMCELLMDPIAPASERAAEYGVADLLPEGFDDWFLQCVNRDAAARFADADEALAALEPIFSGVEPVPVAPAARLSRTPTPARGISLRPAPVTATPSGYTLEIPSTHEDQPFSLDRTAPAGSTGPLRAPTPAPLRAPTPAPLRSPTPAPIQSAPEATALPEPGAVTEPRRRRLAPILLAVLGPVGIAAAVILGLHQSSNVSQSDDAATAAPEASAPRPVTPEVDAAVAPTPTPTPPPVPTTAPDAEPVAVAPQHDAGAVQQTAVTPEPTARPDAGPQRHGTATRPGRNTSEADAGDIASPQGDTTAYTQRVLSQLRGRHPDFVRCYEEHSPPGATGNTHISLHFSISPDGSSASVGVSGPAEVGACVGGILRAMTFPTPVIVTGPFFQDLHFQASQTEPPRDPPADPQPAPSAQ